jgi:hypothetical protein
MATLEQALETASQLPPDQQDMLADILRCRQNDAWRQKAAEEARQSIAAFREGSLSSESSDQAIAQLRKSLDSKIEE